MSEQPDTTDGETDSTLRPTRRQTLGALAAAGVLGATAVGQEEGDLLNAGGGPMSDAQDEFRVQRYRGTFAERPDPGVARRVWEVDDPGHENHGAIYVDDGESWELVDRKVGSLDAEHADINVRENRGEITPKHSVNGRYWNLGYQIHPMDQVSAAQLASSVSVTSGSAEVVSDTSGRGDDVILASGGPTIEFGLTEDIDLSNHSIALSVRSEDSFPHEISVIAADSSGNEVEFSCIHEAEEYAGWKYVDVHFNSGDQSVAEETSQLTLSINEWQGSDGEVYISDFRVVPQPSDNVGWVQFQFDDGRKSVYEDAYPILDNYGVPGVISPITDRFGSFDDHVTVEETRELMESGWDVSSHTHYHSLEQGDIDQQRESMRQARKILGEEGLTRGNDALLYPGGNYYDGTFEIFDDYHTQGYTTGGTATGHALSPKLVTEPRTIRRTFMGNSLSDLKSEVDRAASRGLMCTFYVHHLDDGEISTEDFTEIVEYVADRDDLQVVTPTFVEEMQKQAWSESATEDAAEAEETIERRRYNLRNGRAIHTPLIEDFEVDSLEEISATSLSGSAVLETNDPLAGSTSLKHTSNSEVLDFQNVKITPGMEVSVLFRMEETGNDETEFRLQNDEGGGRYWFTANDGTQGDWLAFYIDDDEQTTTSTNGLTTGDLYRLSLEWDYDYTFTGTLENLDSNDSYELTYQDTAETYDRCWLRIRNSNNDTVFDHVQRKMI